MKKKFFISSIILIIFIFIGSVFIGETNNRLILNIKDMFPSKVKIFLKEKIFFAFDYKNKINNLTIVNSELEERINFLEKETFSLKKNLEVLSKKKL